MVIFCNNYKCKNKIMSRLKIISNAKIMRTCFTCNVCKASPEKMNKWHTIVWWSLYEAKLSQQNVSAFSNTCKTAMRMFHKWNIAYKYNKNYQTLINQWGGSRYSSHKKVLQVQIIFFSTVHNGIHIIITKKWLND